LNVPEGYAMNDVGMKPITARAALATGRIAVGAAAFAPLAARALPKGDALTLAEIAGVMGAKRTSDLLPLCHPLPLERVTLAFTLDPDAYAVHAFCEARTHARTGVEMEALTGVSVALLTVWDLTKPLEPALAIGGVRLLAKDGGKSGAWRHPDGLPALPARFAAWAVAGGAA
jgi:cyclic pyranopterin phosphate synthase